MKTRGTANLDLLTDRELKGLLGSCCLDVYEGAVLGDEEFEFSLDTLEKFMAERSRRRDAAALEGVPPIFPSGGSIQGGGVRFDQGRDVERPGLSDH